EVVKVSASMDDHSEIKRLEHAVQVACEEKDNQMNSLRACKDDIVRAMIFEDLSKIGAEIKELNKQLEVEKSRHFIVSEQQVIDHLTRLANGDIHDLTYRKSLIRSFVNKIFLYDDKFTIIFNTGDEEVTITDVMLSKITSELSGEKLCLSNHAVHHKHRKHLLAVFFFA
ncbi:MAG: hypothetical protein KH282_09360, partial [Clostridiales bacterium]|nr:hypothetical protein [Clostridiales bacterium]